MTIDHGHESQPEQLWTETPDGDVMPSYTGDNGPTFLPTTPGGNRKDLEDTHHELGSLGGHEPTATKSNHGIASTSQEQLSFEAVEAQAINPVEAVRRNLGQPRRKSTRTLDEDHITVRFTKERTDILGGDYSKKV